VNSRGRLKKGRKKLNAGAEGEEKVERWGGRSYGRIAWPGSGNGRGEFIEDAVLPGKK